MLAEHWVGGEGERGEEGKVKGEGKTWLSPVCGQPQPPDREAIPSSPWCVWQIRAV